MMLKHSEDFKEDAKDLIDLINNPATLILFHENLLIKMISSILYTIWLEGYNEGFTDNKGVK